MRTTRLLSMFRVAVAMTLSLVGVGAEAGSSSGRIIVLMAHVHDIVIFETAGDHADRPACSLGSNQWALSLSTLTGRAMYALLLSAQAQGKEVHVMGSGLCDAWGDRERPLYIFMQSN
jgi:hypothetical protein